MPSRVVFDLAKDISNREKHGLGLARAAEMNVLAIADDARFHYGERRLRAWGTIDGRAHGLVYTMTPDGDVRAISLRRAHAKEMRRNVP